MIFTVDLPVTFQVEEASKEKPYFGFRLELDPALVASVVMESDIQIMKGDAITKAMNVTSIDAEHSDLEPHYLLAKANGSSASKCRKNIVKSQ